MSEKIPEFNPTPEDERKMESLVNKAREIIESAEEANKKGEKTKALSNFNYLRAEKFSEDEDQLNEIQRCLKECTDALLDGKSDFYTNVD